ncbi:MAG: alpha/beta hydrolase [Phycisphaerales bacterium JB038]
MPQWPVNPADLLHLANLLGVGLLLWLALTIGFVLHLLTHPKRKGYGWAVARGLPAEPNEGDFPSAAVDEWTVRSRGVDLPVWAITNPSRPTGPTLVLCHAWGESRVSLLDWAEALYPHAGRLVLWDMPGHGEAAGTSTLGMREPQDLAAITGSLPEEAVAAPVVLLGLSMGAGIAIAAAAALGENDRKPAGIIAIGPPRRVQEPARRLFRLVGLPWQVGGRPALQLLAWRFGRWRWFDRLEAARRLSAPLLVLTGAADELCLPAEGRRLAEAAPDGRFLELPRVRHGREIEAVTPAGNGNAERLNPAVQAIVAFLAELPPSPHS